MARTKEYKNEDITIMWKPDLCMHSANCAKGSPSVFDSARRPWVDPSQASTQEIVKTVANCPSGALSIKWNNQTEVPASSDGKIQVLPNGPYLVTGDFVLEDGDGNTLEIKEKAAFCRCGESGNKPFCDGTHSKIGFAG